MLNARWVRERRIEVVAPVATLQTELGEWTLRRGVVPDDVPVREVLRGRVTVDGAPVQIAGVLDDLYADAVHAQLGPAWEDGVPSLAVWAPTARAVDAAPARRARGDGARGGRRLARARRGRPGATPSTRSTSTGASSPTRTRVALTVNSTRSVLAELPPPDDWPKPPPIRAVDASIYELHIRDFSIGDTTVPEEHRGTYLAFTHDSAGHAPPARAGRGGPDDRAPAAVQRHRDDRGGSFSPARIPGRSTTSRPTPRSSSAASARCASATASTGATTRCTTSRPRAPTRVEDRTREFRAMVRALERHRPARRARRRLQPHARRTRAWTSVVPGYYHRLTPTGEIYDSTCCANTATEHRMMEKLMLDALEHWARQYRVDGFRFDLMGHHTKANLLAARERLGPELHLYGEGWSFGEVADDALFVAASQKNMAGTGIGTFNDVLRDAVRGGGPHDADPTVQGWATGDPRAQERVQLGPRRPPAARRLRGAARRRDRLRRRARQRDAVRRAGAQAPARDEHGRPRADEHGRAGHGDAEPEPVLLARGRRPAALEVAGPQLLRLRRLVQPDRLDGHARARGAPGLPPAWDNEERWPFMRPLLADPALKPQPHHIATARERALELLRIRYSSPLFRLGDADAIRRLVRFEPGAPGVIVMVLADEIVVVFNATAAHDHAGGDGARTAPAPGAGRAGVRLRRRRVHGPGADRRSLPPVSSTGIGSTMSNDARSMKPRKAHEPSRRWTSGAANRFGSSSNGSARATSHGPSGESPSTYQVQNGAALALLVGMAGEDQQPLPVDAAHLRDLELAEAARARSAAARAPRSACRRCGRGRARRRTARSAVGSRAVISMCQPSSARNTNGSRQVSLDAVGEHRVVARVGLDQRLGPPRGATSSGRRTRPGRSAGP